MNDNSNNRIITTNYWTWQGMGGFADIYDEIFHTFTPTDNDKIHIGNDYTIWIWKGDYWNLGAGGEIGIYKGTGKSVATTMSEELGISMTMEITDKKGESIINIDEEKKLLNKIFNKNPNKNWWLTGWNPKVQGLSHGDLTLTSVLDFSDNEKSREMYESLKGTEQDDNLKSKINDLGNYRIKVTW